MEDSLSEWHKISYPQSQDDLTHRFYFQRQAYLEMGQTGYATRKMYLETLLKTLNVHQSDLCQAVSKDFGHRSAHETMLLELTPITRSIEYSLKNLAAWMEPRDSEVPIWLKPAKARLLPQALGVVGIVSTWNYPLQLSLMPLISALAAGNRVMLKLSELTPRTNEWLMKIANEIFSLQDVQMIVGGKEISEWFVSLPFDHLFFTGSTAVGKQVLLTASQNLVPVTLELGGKSPAIIAPYYPLTSAVNHILTGKLVNAGQTCIAPDYVFLPQGAESLFVEQSKRFVEKRYPGLPYHADYTTIISPFHVNRLQALLEDARAKGAQIVPLSSSPSDIEGRKLIPTLIFNVSQDMRVMQEEIFGPILPVMTYLHIHDVLHYLKERPKPLAMYLFDNNCRRITDVLTRTVSGGVTLNDTLWHAALDTLPFGGVGDSGMGKYHGKAGFDTFTHYKSIFIQSDFNLLSAVLNTPLKKWFFRSRLMKNSGFLKRSE